MKHAILLLISGWMIKYALFDESLDNLMDTLGTKKMILIIGLLILAYWFYSVRKEGNLKVMGKKI